MPPRWVGPALDDAEAGHRGLSSGLGPGKAEHLRDEWGGGAAVGFQSNQLLGFAGLSP